MFTWASATGSVKAEITSVTPMGDLEMCLSTPDKELGCRTAGNGTLSAKTTKSRETFILTLRGDGTAQPAVNVTLTFPARKPKVSIENARFDGTAYPDTNGIQAVFTPRQNGDVGVVAEWGGHPFTYEIDLIEQGGSGNLTYAPDQGNVGHGRQVRGDGAQPVEARAPEHGVGVRDHADERIHQLAVDGPGPSSRSPGTGGPWP